METQAADSSLTHEPAKPATAEVDAPMIEVREQNATTEGETAAPPPPPPPSIADEDALTNKEVKEQPPQPPQEQQREGGEAEVKLQMNAEVGNKKKRKRTKKIKRDINYPKFYRNAYVRYCEKARDKVCEENPSLDPVEITKLVAANWLGLEKSLKQPYLDEAQLDKDRYERELKEYQALHKSNEEDAIAGDDDEEGEENGERAKKRLKKKENISEELTPAQHSRSTVADHQPSTSSSLTATTTLTTAGPSRPDEIPKSFLTSNCELPIFTDAFLEHNKIIEGELKILRKNTIEIEQQNAVLMKHIENMDNGVRKVEGEIAESRQKNSQLEVYLTKMRVKLSASFNSHSQPGWKNGATVENVDRYLLDLATEAQKHSNSASSAIGKARDILKKMDLKLY